MHKDSASTENIPGVTFQLPEDALTTLTQTRDQLLFLANLTEPRMADEDDTMQLSHGALAHCFARLAADLDRVAQATYRLRVASPKKRRRTR